METILKVQNLSKNFGKIAAVSDLSFEIKKGEIYGLLGPNGSGKSTTLGMLLNVVNKTSGSFSWFDGSISTENALKKVGAIIERPNFYPYMTAIQNLKLVCRIKEIPTNTIDEKLQLVQLYERRNSKFKTFSLGMKQRLAIASALINNPEVLILDEPTNGLDPQGIHEIRAIIKKIAASGTTIIFASHLLDEVEKICDKVLVIRNGVKLYQGSIHALSNSKGIIEVNASDKTALKRFLENQSFVESISEENGLLIIRPNTTIDSAALNKSLLVEGIILNHLVHKQASLEQQFLELTSQKK